jgi:prepilin-type N-terminal cleavage/methylation domain-containing protein
MRHNEMHVWSLAARQGFSLTELLIVVSMLGILAAVAVPLMAPDAADHLQAAADALVNDLAYVRGLATANNSSYRLTFDPSNNRYVLSHSGTNAALNTLPTGVLGSPSDPSNQRIAKLDDMPALGARVKLWSPSAPDVDSGGSGSAAKTIVEFGPYGETAAAQTTLIWLTAGSGVNQRYLAVSVNPVTGLATVGTVQSTAPLTAPM